MNKIKYVCGSCGSSDVEYRTWIPINPQSDEDLILAAKFNNFTLSTVETRECFCNGCENHVEIIVKLE